MYVCTDGRACAHKQVWWAHAQKSRAWAPRAPLLPHFAPYPHFVDVEDLYILWMYIVQVPWMNFTCTGTYRAHYLHLLCLQGAFTLRWPIFFNTVHKELDIIPLCLFFKNNLYFNVVTRTDSSMFYSYSVLFKQRAKWDLGQQQVLSWTVLSSAKPSGSTWW